MRCSGELLLGVLIVLRIEGMPSGTPELEQLEQLLFLEVLVADDVDLLDAGR